MPYYRSAGLFAGAAAWRMVRSFESDAVSTRDAWERRLTDMPVLAMLYPSTAPVDLGDPLEPAQQPR